MKITSFESFLKSAITIDGSSEIKGGVAKGATTTAGGTKPSATCSSGSVKYTSDYYDGCTYWEYYGVKDADIL
jgi:hypothetical protein